MAPTTSSVDLLWLPLGAGDTLGLVRRSGRAYEALVAGLQRRSRADLYHSALEVRVDGAAYAVEMAPVWSSQESARGVVTEGPVGLPWLGRSRLFRYEVRAWAGGSVPDADTAVDSPRRLSADPRLARRVLELVGDVPALTWGRDEQRTGEMWNSNSLTSWLLSRSGHDTTRIAPPRGGRAPGWTAGLVVAARQRPAAGGPAPDVGTLVPAGRGGRPC
jgi:hypothetical protein